MPDALTPLDLDAIEAAIAECRTYNFGMYQADRLAHEHAPALVAEVKRLRAEVAIARQHQREASSTIRSVEGLRKERDDALAEVARLRTMVGDCHCDKNPETANGPEEDCPQHGRPVAEVWGLVERAEAGWDHARAEVDRLRVEVRLAKVSAHSASLALGAQLATRPAPAWDEDAVRAEVDREALRRFVDSFCDDEAGEVEHVVSVDRTSGFALTGGNDAHAVLCKAASALWPGESRATVQAETLRDAADEYEARLPDGTGNGRAYNSYTVAAMLRARGFTHPADTD